MKDIKKALNAGIRVSSIVSNSGNAVANQFIIHTKYGKMFRSYNSNIAFIPNDENIIYLGEDWDYSRTTGKYRNQFLGMDKKELEALIKSGGAKVIKDL